MKIEFELKDNQRVYVFGVEDGQRKVIGQIFTPSSSSGNITNAIQVCGFTEAFDYWGCALYEHNSVPKKQRVINALKDKKDKFIRSKDIQLLFSFDTRMIEHIGRSVDNTCFGCFNNPCTCDNKRENRMDDSINPYNVKREKDVEIEKDESKNNKKDR